MKSATMRPTRRAPRIVRQFSLLLLRIGVSADAVIIAGMLLGIAAGAAFFWTGNPGDATAAWAVGLAAFLARMVCTRIGDTMLQSIPARAEHDFESFPQIPERVSEAVVLIGLGFAEPSNPWLGLSSALLATLSSYLRSVREVDPQSGFMKRTHRQFVVALTALLVLLGTPEAVGPFALPELSLGIITAGCAYTIVVRWLGLEKRLCRERMSQREWDGED